jgi:LacI family transcriptional regulator
MAKAMVLKRRNIRIGILLHVQINDFFEEMIKGIDAAAEEIKDSGITITIRCGKNYDADDQLLLMEEMLSGGIQALVLVPLRDDRVTKRISQLRESGFPVVFLFSPAENADALVFVGCDFAKVGRIAGGLIATITGGMPGCCMPPLRLKC